MFGIRIATNFLNPNSVIQFHLTKIEQDTFQCICIPPGFEPIQFGKFGFEFVEIRSWPVIPFDVQSFDNWKFLQKLTKSQLDDLAQKIDAQFR